MCWYNPHIHEKNHLLGTSNLFQRGEKGRRHTRRGRVVNRQECCLLLGLVLRHAHTKPVGSIAKRVLTTFDWLGGSRTTGEHQIQRPQVSHGIECQDQGRVALFVYLNAFDSKESLRRLVQQQERPDGWRSSWRPDKKLSTCGTVYFFFLLFYLFSFFSLIFIYFFFWGLLTYQHASPFFGTVSSSEREREKKREKERERMITCEPIATSGCVHNPGREWEKITGPFVHRPTAERTARDASTRTRGKGRKRKESSPRVVISFSSATGAISPPYTVGRPAEKEEASLREGSRKTCVCDTQLFTHVRINKAKQGPPTTINAREK